MSSLAGLDAGLDAGLNAGLDVVRETLAGVDAALVSALDALAARDGVAQVDEATDGSLESDGWRALSPSVAADEATDLLRSLESSARRLAAVQSELMTQMERAGIHHVDGHNSVKALARHVCQLSTATATGRARLMRMLGDLPEVAEAFRAGEIGIDQAQLLGRIHANPRVRDTMADSESWFRTQAIELPHAEFERVVRQWERLTDEDGPEPANSRNHDNRNVALVQNHFDLSWTLTGSFGAFQGAAMREILDHYIEAEWLADWEKAKADVGPDACATDLPRTDAQRRADALWQIFQDAAANPPGTTAPKFVHNIVWDAATFEEMVARLHDGYEPQSLHVDQFRCQTVDGAQLEPIEAVVNATVSEIRRVVVDAKGVTIDLGGARRFTGNSRHAVMLSDTRCVWPGCQVPATRCETDHLHDHARGGPTKPANGAVMCGRHNRWKQKGYTIHRDQAGNWDTYRPDGSPVP